MWGGGRLQSGQSPERRFGKRVDVGIDRVDSSGGHLGHLSQEIPVVVGDIVAADFDLVVDDDRAVGVVRQRSERDERLDVLQELAERDRLVHVVLGAGAELLVLLEGLVARLRRHDDERHVLEVRVLLQLVANREPVHPRELDREQDEIRPVGGGLLEAQIAVVDDGGEAS